MRVVNLIKGTVNRKCSKIIESTVETIIDISENIFINHFGKEIILWNNSRNDYTRVLTEWLKPLYKNFNRYAIHGDYTYLRNIEFMVKIDSQTFASIKVGSRYKQYLIDHLADKETIEDVCSNSIRIYVFGKNMYKEYNKIHKIITDNNNSIADVTYMISGKNNEEFSSSAVKFKGRDLSTIFLENHVVESITTHLDKFLENKDIYLERDIIFKTGILLHGNPGTGKTSLLNGIAKKYGMYLVIIDMSKFKDLNIDLLTLSLNSDTRRYLIALEDIDCIIANRDDKDIAREDREVINKLLKFLDSNSSPTNVVFMATTNHLERLDDALRREGRFDLTVEVNGIFKNKVIEMCKSFDLSDKIIEEIIIELNELGIDLVKVPVIQSKLQNLILKRSGLSLRSKEDEES